MKKACSIIVPIYNKARFLDECISSILLWGGTMS